MRAAAALHGRRRRQRRAGGVERGAPVPVAVVCELQVSALAMQPDRDQPDVGPGAEPAVQELQLGRARWELKEAEGGSQCLAQVLFDQADLGGGRSKLLAPLHQKLAAFQRALRVDQQLVDVERLSSDLLRTLSLWRP